jgi:hypothetical protein
MPPIALIALILVITLLALNGVEMAIAAFRSGAGEPPAPAVGEPITTSYGTMTVVLAETIGGLTAEELGGMVHGVGNLVLSDSAQVEVAVSLTNDSPRAIRVSAAQFRLLVAGSTRMVEPTGTTIETTRLAAGASIEAAFTFVVPQGGEALTLSYTDPGTNSVLAVPIGALGVAPPAAGNDHPH